MLEQSATDTTMETLGSRLRRTRKEKGWTQEQLAQKTGTSQAVIQKIENGKSLRPRKIDRIAEVLDVSPAWLQFGTETTGPTADMPDSEALEVARIWSGLDEPYRSTLKEAIMEAAGISVHDAVDMMMSNHY